MFDMVNSFIAGTLTVSGLTTGIIYALLGLSIVLVFSVTRVMFIPQGEFVAYSALTMAMLNSHQFPHSASLLVVLGGLCFVVEALRRFRAHLHTPSKIWLYMLARDILLPIGIYAVVRYLAPLESTGLVLQGLMTLLIIIPLGPLVYRLAFEPVASASTLNLMIIAIAVHFALTGLGLVIFGPEGMRIQPYMAGRVMLGSVAVSWQSILVMTSAALLVLGLYIYFSRTFMGKALTAMSVNPLGARLVGINTERAGRMTFVIAAAVGAVSGILIVPLTTIYYNTGFLISLKGFVGAVFGGLASYPLTALGSILVGLIESWASFFASTYKDVIVFILIIPLLIWLSISQGRGLDAEDDE